MQLYAHAFIRMAAMRRAASFLKSWLMASGFMAAPLVAAALLAGTAGQLQAAVTGIHPGYAIEKIRPAGMTWPIGDMDFFSNGDMAVASWKDPYDVYIVKNATGAAGGATLSLFAQGLSETLGLVVVHDTVFVMQKDELTALIDNDKDGVADEYRTIADRFSKSTMEKEYAGGLTYDGTYFYAAFGDQTVTSGTAVDPMMPGRLNGALRFSRDGTVTPYAGGFRVPLGVGSAYGEMWTTENQGGYRPSNALYNIREKRWYGRPVNPPSAFQPGPYVKIPDPSTFFQPAVWMPYAMAGGYSPGNPLQLKDGPFKGQILVPDASTSGTGICRNFIEKVKGEYQGATIPFSKKTGAGGFEQGVVLRIKYGPDGAIYCGANGADGAGWGRFTHIGLDRLKLSGKTVMDIQALRNLDANTMEFEFTKPLGDAAGADLKADLAGTKWREEPQEPYGGGHMLDKAALAISSAIVSADKLRLTVKVAGLTQGGWVHDFKLTGITAADGEALWGNEAWYTLNNFGPADAVPDAVAPRNWSDRGKDRPFILSRNGEGYRLRIAVPYNRSYRITVTDPRGRVQAMREGTGNGEISLAVPERSGLLILKFISGSETFSQLLTR